MNLLEAQSTFSSVKLKYLDSTSAEIETSFIRKWLEKRQFVKRHLILSDIWIIQTRSYEFPDQLFFYARPQVYEEAAAIQRAQSVLTDVFYTHELINAVACYDRAAGIIWLARMPLRHHHLQQIMFEYAVSEENRSSAEQGFMTSYGRFLSRKEGYELARTAGQFNRVVSGSNTYQGQELYSEDLW